MTQDKNHGPENRNWMEIAETDAINDVRHVGSDFHLLPLQSHF